MRYQIIWHSLLNGGEGVLDVFWFDDKSSAEEAKDFLQSRIPAIRYEVVEVEEEEPDVEH